MQLPPDQPGGAAELIGNKMSKNNNSNIGHNGNEVSKESYENLAKNFKEILKYADDVLWDIRHRFDEAFTKQEHSNPRSRKLKDFEVHERRADANNKTSKLKKELKQEIDRLEQGVLKYGIDIRDKDDEADDE